MERIKTLETRDLCESAKNGGCGDAFTKVGDSGTTATAAEAGVFLRKGHTFAGWNTKADGTGTAYQAGADVAYPAEGDTLTLYAQWKRVPETTLPDTGGSGHADHAPSAISGLAMASAAVLSISAHRRRREHANPPV